MISASTKAKIVVGVAFQILWFALVSMAKHGVSPLVSLACLMAVVLLVKAYGTQPATDAQFVLLATLFGIVVDSILITTGVFTPARGLLPHPIVPLWLIALWAAFAMFLRIVLSYLKGRVCVQAILGAFGGPAAYWSGARLGAIEFPSPPFVSLTVIGIVWAVTCVLFFKFSERLTCVREGKA